MKTEEIVDAARNAGFSSSEIMHRLAAFKQLINSAACAEREKFTNTQEFVTLPRELVERALKVLEYAANDVLTGRNAATELRAALEQPDHSEQSYMGCVTSDMHELAEWLNTMYEDSKEQITALEQPQNHIPDAGNMVPAGWKLVPVELTHEMLRAGRDAHYEAEKRIQDQDAWSPGGFAKRAVRAAHVFRAMLAAAPQPPTAEQPSAVQQPQVEQEPDAWLHSEGKAQPLYLDPQPKREPLSMAQIAEVFGWKPGYLPTPEQVHDARAIEAAHNIK